MEVTGYGKKSVFSNYNFYDFDIIECNSAPDRWNPNEGLDQSELWNCWIPNSDRYLDFL